MKVAPVSGDLAVKLALGIALGVLVWYGWRRAAGAVAELPGQLWQSVTDAAADAADAVHAGILDTRQAIADSNPANPGYNLPPGWYRVNTRWGEVVTQHPDSFKTINPFDTLGLIDP